MKYIKKYEETNNKKYSFTINDLITFFKEKHTFFDKTHSFLRKAILNKYVSFKPFKDKNNILYKKYFNKQIEYNNVKVLDLIYSPSSSEMFCVDFKNLRFVGIDEFIITLEYDVPSDIKKVLEDVELKIQTNKYNI